MLTAAALMLPLLAAPAEPIIANPASVHCIERGGRLQIVTTKKGQIGICVFPNGRRIEEWTLYRRDKARRRGPEPRL